MSPEDEARVREIVNEVLDENGPMGTGHQSFADPVNGGWTGYVGACWDCDYRGPLRQDKSEARHDASRHAAEAPGAYPR